MDPFAIVILAGLAVMLLWFWVLGRYFPGSGLDQLGLRTPRQIVEEREQLEAEDLDQMLAAHNERRRRRGKAEVTVADLEHQVMQDVGEVNRRRESYLADRELDQLLEVTNARRQKRGLPARTREEVQREFGGAPGPGASGQRSSGQGASEPGASEPGE